MDISIKQEEKRVISRTSYQTRRRLTWVIFMLPAIAVYVAFMAFPLFNSMRLSLYTGQGLTPERFVGFDNYVRLFTNPLWRDAWLNAFGNTWVFFAVHMLVQNTLGLLFAVLLTQNIRGRSIYQVIIFAPVTLSTLVIGFLWRLLLNPQWGAVNYTLEAIGLESLTRPWLGDPSIALIVISLVSCWQWVGLPTMMFMAGLLGIPDEVIEAAYVDGASSWQTFWRIKFPLLLPVIGIVAVLTFVNNFNAFDIIFAMAGSRGEPGYSTDILGTFFYRTAIAGEHPVARPDMGMGAAVATITFLVLMVGVSLWLFFSRRREVEL
ncbi:MAG TPA: sugar ABC transporter permease [Aggregatilineales bacterium]|nr:sugar ABC transporter permease [Chloroflexota bacterium]HOA22427.1 sugar ABC transporter permease [Aggregatilineales bacterium]HQA68580.1 sugar ABC transporter permease [Aggregatilineales bacterium]HQE17698.1 sugar ABC transporter permease [Aggregatilineales bacterium]